MNEFYIITDLDGYARTIRDGAAKSFAEDYTENLDDFISIGQVKNLIKKMSQIDEDTGDLIITEDIYNDTFDEIRDLIYGVGLAKLSSKGVVECAWDNNLNRMIFWLADENKTQISSKPSEHNG